MSRHGSTHAGMALHLNGTIMPLHNMLGDGQPQTGAPGLLGTAFVHPVKPLKNPSLVLSGNADAGIPHLKDGVLSLLPGPDGHRGPPAYCT